MIEKRKVKRVKVRLELQISSLFKQDNVVVERKDAPINVCDISTNGIGFIAESNLPLGYYFNACIQLGNEDAKLYCVVKIIRQDPMDETSFLYGCEFVGLAPVLSCIIDDYEKSLEENQE